MRSILNLEIYETYELFIKDEDDIYISISNDNVYHIINKYLNGKELSEVNLYFRIKLRNYNPLLVLNSF